MDKVKYAVIGLGWFGEPGLKAHRGMIVRRALALFLETRASGPSAPSL